MYKFDELSDKHEILKGAHFYWHDLRAFMACKLGIKIKFAIKRKIIHQFTNSDKLLKFFRRVRIMYLFYPYGLILSRIAHSH